MVDEFVKEFNSLYEYRNRLIKTGQIRDGQLVAINRKLKLLHDKIQQLIAL